mmetsp:Transcript_57711/g.162759  ORF Transcript_57711/g.162759 Transcript_57711/m.162759 type:complete len:375 (+) Transcript_57711:225-1349(+)
MNSFAPSSGTLHGRVPHSLLLQGLLPHRLQGLLFWLLLHRALRRRQRLPRAGHLPPPALLLALCGVFDLEHLLHLPVIHDQVLRVHQCLIEKNKLAENPPIADDGVVVEAIRNAGSVARLVCDVGQTHDAAENQHGEHAHVSAFPVVMRQLIRLGAALGHREARAERRALAEPPPPEEVGVQDALRDGGGGAVQEVGLPDVPVQPPRQHRRRPQRLRHEAAHLRRLRGPPVPHVQARRRVLLPHVHPLVAQRLDQVVARGEGHARAVPGLPPPAGAVEEVLQGSALELRGREDQALEGPAVRVPVVRGGGPLGLARAGHEVESGDVREQLRGVGDVPGAARAARARGLLAAGSVQARGFLRGGLPLGCHLGRKR